ncbi:hypothetical protein HD554DRAFT_2039355 [Boletus coccyginus]|nr:hypothetical protein HD554DRAFT_2039355 [Boletus coccyginus]
MAVQVAKLVVAAVTQNSVGGLGCRQRTYSYSASYHDCLCAESAGTLILILGLTPLVALHGGPGMSHYMDSRISHTEIYTTYGIPGIFYVRPDRHRSIVGWFVRWGLCIPAASRLRRLIIPNALASNTLWEERMLQHLSKFPQGFQYLSWKQERERKASSKGYRDALQAYLTGHFLARGVGNIFQSNDRRSWCTRRYWVPMSSTRQALYLVCHRSSPRDHLPALIVRGYRKGAQDLVIAPFLEKFTR